MFFGYDSERTAAFLLTNEENTKQIIIMVIISTEFKEYR